MYIQKTRSQRKGVLQLGVYLHRQSVPQNYNSSSASSAEAQQQPHEAYNSNNNTSPTSPSPSAHLNQQAWSFSRYSDKRKVVKTWFKIYCPTRGPKHALTLFQSSPDNFSVLQSWVSVGSIKLEYLYSDFFLTRDGEVLHYVLMKILAIFMSVPR